MSKLGTREQANGLAFAGLAGTAYPNTGSTPDQDEVRNVYDAPSGLQVQHQFHVLAGNTYSVLRHYHDGVLVFGTAAPGPDPDPDPEIPVPAANIITITNPTASTVTNAPIRMGQQFKEGAITAFPTGRIDGEVFETQANVKTRWNDTSVKHAIISFILPTIAAGESIEIDFISTSSGNNVPLTKTELLNARFDFDAVFDIDLYGGNTPSISARTMLNADHYELWNEGQVATTLLLRDHSPAKTYAIGHDANVSLWPSFEVTFWNAIDTVEVRFIMESPDTETLQDEAYDISLTMGDSSPAVVYTKSEFYHRGFSRWTKKFWNNPQPNLNRDIDFQSNIDANAFHNFDTTRVASEEQIASYYATYQTKDIDIGDKGKWQSSMGSTGGREDIGIVVNWNARWLINGDWRHREIVLKHTDLAGQWPNAIREGIEGWYFDLQETVDNYGIHLTINPTGRYTHGVQQLTGSEILPEHRIEALQPRLSSYIYTIYRFDTIISIAVDTPVKYIDADEITETTVKQVVHTGNYFLIAFWANPKSLEIGDTFEMDVGAGWVASGTNFSSLRFDTWALDGAHYPNHASSTYFVEGDNYYLDQMLNDAAWLIGTGNPASETILGRGRDSTDGRLPGTQVRGLAWQFNIRLYASDFVPDGHYFKDYSLRLNKNAVAFLAGEMARSNPFPGDADRTDMFNHALNVILPTRFTKSGSAGPIGYAKDSAYTIDESTFDITVVSQANAPWQLNFLIGAVGRAQELGYPTEELIEYFGRHIYTIWAYPESQMAREIIAAYKMASLNMSSEWFQDKLAVYNAYNPDYIQDRIDYVTNSNSGVAYDVRSRPAASYLTHLPNGAAMWEWYENNVNLKTAFDEHPKSALNPRIAPPDVPPVEPPVEFTALQEFADEMVAGEWKQIPGTQPTTAVNGFRTVTEINAIVEENPGCAPMWGQAGSQSLFGGENGAAWDGQKMYFTGGGHFDYGGNEIYAFNFAADVLSLGWERISEPYPLIVDWPYVEKIVDGSPVPANDPPVPATCKLPFDGPSPAHTWNKLCYNPENNSIVLLGGDFIGYCADYYHAKTGKNLHWEFMLDTGAWRSFPSVKTTFLDSPNDIGGSVYYPPLKQMIHWPRFGWGADRKGPTAYDKNGVVQRARDENSSTGGTRKLIYNPNDGYVYFAFGGTVNKMVKWDPSTDPLTEDLVELAAAPQALLDQNPDSAFPWSEGGFALNETDNTIMMWAGNQSTWVYDITADTWTENANLVGADPTSEEKHIYSKWQYIPEVGVYVGGAEGHQDLWAYKPEHRTVDFAFTEIPELFFISDQAEDYNMGIYQLDFANLWPQNYFPEETHGWIPEKEISFIHESGDIITSVTYNPANGVLSYDGTVTGSILGGIYYLERDGYESMRFNIRILVLDLTWGVGGDIEPVGSGNGETELSLTDTMKAYTADQDHYVLGIMPGDYLNEKFAVPGNVSSTPGIIYIYGLGARHAVNFSRDDGETFGYKSERGDLVSIKNIDSTQHGAYYFGYRCGGVNIQQCKIEGIGNSSKGTNGIIYSTRQKWGKTNNFYLTETEVLHCGDNSGLDHNLYIENRESADSKNGRAVFNCIKSYAPFGGHCLKTITKKVWLFNSYLGSLDSYDPDQADPRPLANDNDLFNMASAGNACIFNNLFISAKEAENGETGKRHLYFTGRRSIQRNDDPSPHVPHADSYEYYDDIRSLDKYSLSNPYLFSKCMAFNSFETRNLTGWVKTVQLCRDDGTYPAYYMGTGYQSYFYDVIRSNGSQDGWFEKSVSFWINNDITSQDNDQYSSFDDTNMYQIDTTGENWDSSSEITEAQKNSIRTDFPGKYVDIGGNTIETNIVSKLTKIPVKFPFSQNHIDALVPFKSSFDNSIGEVKEISGAVANNNTNSLIDVATSDPRNSGTKQILAYSGGTVGQIGNSSCKYLFIFGGGHLNYSGNEIYAFGPLDGPGSNNPRWKLIDPGTDIALIHDPNRRPEGLVPETFKLDDEDEIIYDDDDGFPVVISNADAYYLDGLPASIHSRDILQYVNGTMFTTRQSAAYGPGDVKDKESVNAFDFRMREDQNTSPRTFYMPGWTEQDDLPDNPSTEDGNNIYDMVRNRLYYFEKNPTYLSKYYYYTPFADNWKGPFDTGCLNNNYDNTGAYSKERDEAIIWSRTTDKNIIHVDLSGDDPLTCTVIEPTGASFDHLYSSTIDYDSVNDCYWIWSLGDVQSLHRLDPDTYALTRVPYDNIDLLRNGDIKTEGHCYHRMNYIKELGGIMVMHSYSGAVWLYRTHK